MDSHDLTDESPRQNVHDFLHVVSRRRWIIAITLVLTPIVAFALSSLRASVYEASSDVLIARSNLAAVATDEFGIVAAGDPERDTATQAKLARLPEIADRTVTASGFDLTPEEFLDRSRVDSDANSDVLTFSARDGTSDGAVRLATAYAKEFVDYRNDLDRASITRARTQIEREIARLRRSGDTDSAVYASLVRSDRRLAAAEALRPETATVVQPALEATKVSPQPLRAGMLGVGLGIILALGLAYLADALDTRVRTREEIEDELRLPVLGELPPPPVIAGSPRPAILVMPNGVFSESVRKLRTNLDLIALDSDTKTIAVTSAIAREGKTTTAANLAGALALAGRNVVLCDLDARLPSVAAAFGLGHTPGLVDVAIGAASLRESLVPIELVQSTNGRSPGDRGLRASLASERQWPGEAGAWRAMPGGSLRVLPFGRLQPPSPADFVGSRHVRQVIEDLAAQADVVLLDTPPIMPVSDPLTISEYVDAAVLVCRLKMLRRPMLKALRHFVTTTRATALGIIVTDSETEIDYGAYLVRADDVVPAQPAARPQVETTQSSR